MRMSWPTSVARLLALHGPDERDNPSQYCRLSLQPVFGGTGTSLGGDFRRLVKARVTHSGRLVLRKKRHWNICRRFCQINRILAISGMAKKTLLVNNLITAAELSPHRSRHQSM